MPLQASSFLSQRLNKWLEGGLQSWPGLYLRKPLAQEPRTPLINNNFIHAATVPSTLFLLITILQTLRCCQYGRITPNHQYNTVHAL